MGEDLTPLHPQEGGRWIDAGKGKILGDIITPVSPAEEWRCLE
jgi:hypothetical protein